MKKLAVTAVLAALTAGSISAQVITGNKLYSYLNSSDTNYRYAAVGYIAGVMDTGSEAVHCAPPSVTLSQVTEMVEQTLHGMPEKRHYSADRIVMAVLEFNWPSKIIRSQTKVKRYDYRTDCMGYYG